MRICKNCGYEVFDDDLKYCSRCGTDLSKKENVAESNYILDVKEDGEYKIEEVKAKKRWICFFLQFFVGFTGAPFFYIGFVVRGFAWLGINLVILLIAFLFQNPFLFVAIILINIAVSMGWLFKKELIDSKGNDLR